MQTMAMERLEVYVDLEAGPGLKKRDADKIVWQPVKVDRGAGLQRRDLRDAASASEKAAALLHAAYRVLGNTKAQSHIIDLQGGLLEVCNLITRRAMGCMRQFGAVAENPIGLRASKRGRRSSRKTGKRSWR